MEAQDALSVLPNSLRDTLIAEYQAILQNYLEHRWGPSELSGGRFCEIVYSIVNGYASGTYPTQPAKPGNFLTACRALENNASLPRSFQILIPRILPALYEVRNNRGVGHVGGDVDPNHMDATYVVSSANWCMAELVRVLHTTSTEDAQVVTDALAATKIPLVWQLGDIKRLLIPDLKLNHQILILLASSFEAVTITTLQQWAMYSNKPYFTKTLRKLEQDRKLILLDQGQKAQILPPGSVQVSELLSTLAAK